MLRTANDTVKNLMLQGPPGTGKTRLAKQIALCLQKDGILIGDDIYDKIEAFEA
jgi:MoxR-like ATPase